MTTATRTRDSQRSAVYAAEGLVRSLLDTQHDIPTTRLAGSTVTIPQERRWADLQSLQEYVSRLAPGVRVREREGQDKAHYERATATIAVPTRRTRTRSTPWAMRQLVVLHEIAHHRAPGGHGPEFCAAFLDLVGQEMGPEAEFLLRVTYLESGVRIN